MAIRTRRWNEPVAEGDGLRLLICRLRPRGVPKATQPWDDWWPELGPSRELLDAYHGKGRAGPLPWEDYERRYLAEMQAPAALWRIRALVSRLAEGETVTLLCSSACVEPARCHRTLLASLFGARSATGDGVARELNARAARG